jgi:hypothetical protein
VSTPCADPLADDVLLDLWTGEFSAVRRRSVEAHLLACEGCAQRMARIQAIADGMRALAQQGRVPAVVFPAVVERLRQDGRRIRDYRVAPGGTVHCTVAPDDDVVLSRLGADFRGVGRVDLVAQVDEGPEQRLHDLPFDPASNELLLVPAIEGLVERAHVMRFRLLAVEPGGERSLGEYTFNHRPWPGW